MTEAIKYNLNRGIKLLNSIDDNQYSDTTIAPYYSSIGGHMRHILDVFDCIFEGLDCCEVDLTARKRNELAETKTNVGIDYFHRIIEQLDQVKNDDLNLNQIVKVSDDLGLGKITVNYTLSAALIQAHSHAIHHFASIGYIISQLGIDLPDADFGYNPTTPKKQELDF
jgi:uncharacterized damage-inducible protein DinB